jgi:hypothetical protein
MKRRFLIPLITIAMMAPLYSQEKKQAGTKEVKKAESEKKEQETVKPKSYTVYQEITLEDFETTPYTDKNIYFNSTGYQEASLSIRDQNPAPNGRSKKYLGVKVRARAGDTFIIKPAKELLIDKYCKSISLWVYGKDYAGVLWMLLMDTDQKTYKLRVGSLNFLGWRKLTIGIPARVAQQDLFLNQKKHLKILQLQYTAVNREELARHQYFYIDDITAMVRDKYDDKQSDEW